MQRSNRSDLETAELPQSMNPGNGPSPDETTKPFAWAAPLMIGAVLLSRYTIQRQLGSGGFGDVFLATDERLLRRYVVIKVIKGQKLGKDWLALELTALARLHHPNIVGVLDFGELPDGRSILVMEYAPGQPLRDLIPPGGMALSDAAEIIRQLGLALDAAHQQGILHRDIKPENVMVNRSAAGELPLKLIDFGIAKIREGISTDTQSSEIIGSMRYMAPEQMDGRATTHSDQFALALVAFEILTGTLPVQEKTPILLYKAYMTGQLADIAQFRPGLSEEVSQVFRRALAFHGTERFENLREFSESLTRILRSVKAPASRPVPAGRLLPKMCDRRMQEDQFKSAFADGWRKSGVMFFAIHGAEGEGHDSLVERCSHMALRYLAGSPGLHLRQVPWPYEGDLRVRWQRLITSLGEQFFADDDMATAWPVERLGEAVALRQPAWISISHEIRSSKWDADLERLINGYARWLWPIGKRSASQPPLLVFLKIVHPPAGERGGRLDSVMRLFGKSRASAAPVPSLSLVMQQSGVALLEELQPVSREDVMEWFSLYDVLDSEERRMAASYHLFPATESRDRIPLSRVEPFLEWMQKQCLAQRGNL